MLQDTAVVDVVAEATTTTKVVMAVRLVNQAD
jgi:hypothetical protein